MCPQCVEAMARLEKCIRENPREAALTSLGAGFLLAQLPLRLLMATVARIVLLVLKPTVLLYGVYRMAEDMHEQPKTETEGQV